MEHVQVRSSFLFKIAFFSVAEPWHFGVDPDPYPRIYASDPDPGSWSGSRFRILLFSSLTFRMPAKNKFFNTIFSAYYFLKVHLHHFSKIKSQKESQNSRNQGFSYYFCMMIEGSIPLISGSGSWRPKNMWIRWIQIRIRIRIRIRNTGFFDFAF